MKFAVISDLHIDLHKWNWKLLDNIPSDILTIIVAGDISNDVWISTKWLYKLKQRFTNVIWVAGNHDFYNQGFHSTRVYNKEYEELYPYPKTVNEIIIYFTNWCNDHGISFLHRNSVDIDGIKFIGATGWHDFVAGEPFDTNMQTKVWYNVISDRYIPWNDSYQLDHNNPLNASVLDYEYIKNISSSISTSSVVITHHLPNRKFCIQRPDDQIWTALHGCFVNTKMENIINPNIKYWIYGHTHQRGIETINDTTYICNARGYVNENQNWFPIILKI